MRVKPTVLSRVMPPLAPARGPARILARNSPTCGDVQDTLTRPQAAPCHEAAAERREERDVLVVLAGEFIEEPLDGLGVCHGLHHQPHPPWGASIAQAAGKAKPPMAAS